MSETEGPDTCNQCGKRFDAKGNLGDSYYLCDECAQGMTRALVRHGVTQSVTVKPSDVDAITTEVRAIGEQQWTVAELYAELAKTRIEYRKARDELAELELQGLAVILGQVEEREVELTAARRAMKVAERLKRERWSDSEYMRNVVLECDREKARAKILASRVQQLEVVTQTTTNRALSMLAGSNVNADAKRALEQSIRLAEEALEVLRMLDAHRVPGSGLKDRVGSLLGERSLVVEGTEVR